MDELTKTLRDIARSYCQPAEDVDDVPDYDPYTYYCRHCEQAWERTEMMESWEPHGELLLFCPKCGPEGELS